MINFEISIPDLPKFQRESPKVVQTMDSIRYEVDSKGEEYAEFYWFSREYPRFYRYHIDNIENRLKNIHDLYVYHKKYFIEKINEKSDFKSVLWSFSSLESNKIYWEFEALLSTFSTTLDLLARIIGVAYEDQTPVSLNKMTSKQELKGIVDTLRLAKEAWINNMKDYRDCFTHYTPVDNIVFVTVYKLRKNYKMWCQIPINPNIREVEGFEFSRKLDLLSYSVSLYDNLMKLDSEIALQIQELYNVGHFPKRIDNLFFIGQRSRK